MDIHTKLLRNINFDHHIGVIYYAKQFGKQHAEHAEFLKFITLLLLTPFSQVTYHFKVCKTCHPSEVVLLH